MSGWGGVSLSGTLLRVTGPLLRNYLVNRYMQDSDGGRKHRTCVRCMQGVCGGFGTRRPSNQEAFSVRRPRGGRSVVLLSSFHPQFDDSFTSTRCLYLSPSQLCLIKRICTSYASARTHTCPCAYARARTWVYIQVDILYSGTSPVGYNACAWTLAARESVCSVQSILGGGASLQFRRGVSL